MIGYRTIIVNLIMVIAGLAGMSISPDQSMAYADAFILLWGGVNVVLRAITKTPIGSRVPVVSLVLLMAVLASCVPINPTTPRQQLLVLEYSYAGALTTANHLIDIGLITKAEAPAAMALVKQTSLALDNAETAVKTGQPSTDLLTLANSALTSLVTYLETKNATSPPSRTGSLSDPAAYHSGNRLSELDFLHPPEGSLRRPGCDGRRIDRGAACSGRGGASAYAAA